jgi:hypothetical protein
MPLYRFHTNAGPNGPNPVAEYELASVRDAQFEAIRYLGELLRDDGLEFWVNEEAFLFVTDDQGKQLFRLQLGLA